MAKALVGASLSVSVLFVAKPNSDSCVSSRKDKEQKAMSRIVRQSKYRHVFGKAFKREKCYDNIKLSRNAWDSNYICANLKFFAVCVEAAGGGSFVVVPFELKGKLKSDFPLVAGHKAAVLDLDFNPFNDHLVASASEDGTAKIWAIPEGGLTETVRDAVQNLTGHKRKVGSVNWNPTANNVLATSSTDYAVKLWDVEKGQAKNTVDGHGNIIQTCAWNYDGSQLVTACKDKKVRLLDPRSNAIVSVSFAFFVFGCYYYYYIFKTIYWFIFLFL